MAAAVRGLCPGGVDAVIDRSTWTPQPIFGLIAEAGRVSRAEMERTFNLGVGMVAVVAAYQADAAVRLLQQREVPAWQLGEIRSGTGSVTLHGEFGGSAADGYGQ